MGGRRRLKTVTVCIPYSRTICWLQILLCSLIENTDLKDLEIVILDNGPDSDESYKGMDFDKFDWFGLEYRVVPKEYRSHSMCMDWILPQIQTPYFMMLESDCRVFRKDWLKNFLDPIMKDDLVAMAGWYWEVPGGDRNYIGPGATIYNTKIVQGIAEEVKRNKKLTFCYGDDLRNRKDVPAWSVEKIHYGTLGPFSEFRGYHDIWLRYDAKWWQEPCAWLYYRCRSEYECVKLPGLYEEQFHDVQVAVGTHYGHPDTYLTHFWGGTVSHDWEKHPVTADWQLMVLPWWIDREMSIWKEVVPEHIRKKTLELGLVKSKEEILAHPNVKPGRERLGLK